MSVWRVVCVSKRNITPIKSPASSQLIPKKMVMRRLLLRSLARFTSPLLSKPKPKPIPLLSSPPLFLHLSPSRTLQSHPLHIFYPTRNFTTKDFNSSDKDYEDADDGDEDEDESDEEEEAGEADRGSVLASSSNCIVERAPSDKEEAAAIGYEVLGPLDPSEWPFKRWEPLFAVVQIGSHQFKVCNGDAIYTERLKHCEVNDKLILNRVLMLGSKTQTIIGRPRLPDAAVHAVVEEHGKDAKVIIFKKKRRKNYRRTKGHRQELTRLRITDIQGIEKPQKETATA